MGAIIAEFATYLVKYLVLLTVACGGFIAGKAYRSVADKKKGKTE